ncbi:uncharacterized protein LOC123515136 isoform X2 [Portunus trituberculatus]|uniref:uncharacterized protein LOC123515136 isoform X2 n=1 Tax=Portunus trituberculatus TaxID=210409 RepID=UPI001E1CF1AB|nr:uncharacterized protein LOC123515136 isoform X2 [Portunus trituberculatus]
MYRLVSKAAVVIMVRIILAQDPQPEVEGPTIISSLSPLSPGEERVLALQESGIPSALSYARLAAPPFPVLSSFTTCYWLRLTRFREESTLMSYAVSDDRDNELRMGQEQDRFGGGFQRDQSFSGEITQLNFWSSVLSPSTISKIARCEEEQEGNVLSWSSQRWNISGEVAWKVWQKEDICNRQRRRVTFFPDRFSLKASLHLCKVVGGSVMVPLDDQENMRLYERSQGRATYCSKGQGSSYLWMGATDSRQERLWEYWETNEPVSWEGPWRGSGPNGGTAENCLVMLSGTFPSRWSDIACLDSYEFCVPCEFPQLSTLYLKGPAVCPNSPFNQEYVLGAERGGRPALHGFFHSDIYWETGNKSWTIRSLKEEGATALWQPLREGNYPFGTKTWKLAGEVCNILPGTLVNLTLSVCRNDQFTCSDGTCIPLENRCDLRIDCGDQSDEAQCSVVQLPQGYRNTIPPPPTQEGSPLQVLIYINIIAFPSIVTQDLTYVSTMSLSLQWKDVRLSYLNLKDDRTLNLLFGEAVASIWTPRVFFSNAQGNIFTNLDQGARVEVVRQGTSKPAPPHLTHEMNIFSGLENSLETSQLYTLTYTCDFDLIMFPFDAQVCFLRFTLVSAAATYMQLVPAAANYSGPPALIEYTIGRLDMERVSGGEFSTIQVNVRFIRRYGFYLLTLYIPTTLLMVIAYATFFFKIDDFNSRIVVALTALLVLASLFTQVISKDAEAQEEIPTFAPSTPEKKNNMALMVFGRILVPIIFLIFNLTYWGSALTHLANLDT